MLMVLYLRKLLTNLVSRALLVSLILTGWLTLLALCYFIIYQFLHLIFCFFFLFFFFSFFTFWFFCLFGGVCGDCPLFSFLYSFLSLSFPLFSKYSLSFQFFFLTFIFLLIAFSFSMPFLIFLSQSAGTEEYADRITAIAPRFTLNCLE